MYFGSSSGSLARITQEKGRSYRRVVSINQELFALGLFFRSEIGIMFDDVINVGYASEGRGNWLKEHGSGVISLSGFEFVTLWKISGTFVSQAGSSS